MYIKVHVMPGSRKETIEKTGDSSFTIAVREKAERNQANTRVRALMALHYRVSPSNVRILTGHRSPVKMLSIDN